MTTPSITSVRTEHKPESVWPEDGPPLLCGIVSPAEDLVVVQVENFGRHSAAKTLHFSVAGSVADGYCALDPNDRNAIEARVLGAHQRDLAAERAGD